MFFESWEALGRTLVIGVSAYAALILILRISGKRTLSKWNAFDFIVTIALGSTLATAILSRDIPLAEGVLALALLIFLQLIVTRLTVRSDWVARVVKAQPTLLLSNGRFRREAMHRERVPESEILATLRQHGVGAIDEVAAVVLETDGSFSVIQELARTKSSTLRDVRGFESSGA